VVAIETARLFEATNRQIEELTILHAVAVASTEFLTEDNLIESITKLIASSLYPDNFGVLLCDEKNKMLTYHYSYQERIPIVHEPVYLGIGIVGLVAQSGSSRNIHDTLSDQNYSSVDEAIRSELCVPVRSGEKIIGVINAESIHINNFSDDDERLLLTIANQMATAIMKIRSFEAERRRVTELESLRQATLHLTSSLDLPQETLLVFALKLVQADIGYFFLYEDDIISFGAVKWLGDEPEHLYYIEPHQNGLTKTVARTGKRLIISDASTHPFYHNHPWNGAIAGLPLRRGDTVLGVLILIFQEVIHDFDENELRILELLADEAVIAITNAQLYTESQEKARELETLDRQKGRQTQK
jgi:GAF domain-containing protein